MMMMNLALSMFVCLFLMATIETITMNCIRVFCIRILVFMAHQHRFITAYTRAKTCTDNGPQVK